jgi:hypothetical protein
MAAGSSLLTLGLMAAPAAHATTGTPEGIGSPGNGLSYADADGLPGFNWSAISNATLSSDTSNSYLHGQSLRDNLPAAGTSSFGLGNQQIPVTGGAQYRFGAYIQNSPTGSMSLATSVTPYDSSGTALTPVSCGSLGLATDGLWHYRWYSCTMPSNAASIIGGPVETLTGAGLHQNLRLDEISFESMRAATAIGSEGDHCADGTCGSYSAADWIDSNSTGSTGIGPLQVNKEFFGVGAGLTWSSTKCAGIEANYTDHRQWPICIVAYKDQVSAATLDAFMAAVPADQAVTLVFHQEPEGDFTSGSVFVGQFETQYNNYLASQATSVKPNITMVMDSASFPYKGSGAGTDCSYIVPATETDGYYMDFYESTVDGNAIPSNSDRGSAWLKWQSCGVTSSGKPVGIAEEGYDQSTSSNRANTPAAMSADAAYLQGYAGTFHQLMAVRTYWWTDFGGAGGSWHFDNTACSGCQDLWKSLETANGGS